MIIRLNLLAALLLLAVCPRVAVSTEAVPERPNFLFIAVDDLNHYVSFLLDQDGHLLNKVYPDPELRAEVGRRLTPNLQRLAEESMVFSRAYCASALCGPSRTAILTGVPPHRSGYYNHQKNFRYYDTLEEVVTLPQYLKDQGYFTTGLGKVFHKGVVEVKSNLLNDWPDTAASWSQWIERPSGANGPGRKVIRSPYSPDDSLFNWGRAQVNARETNDFLNARFAAELLVSGEASIIDRHGVLQTVTLPDDQPFFLACGIFAPHLPWVMPEAFFDLFPTDEMALDQAAVDWVEADLDDLPEFAVNRFIGGDWESIRETGERVDGSGGLVNAWKSSIQAYLAAIAYADFCLGNLVDAVEQNPNADNTVVILWSDHGWHLGDKQRFRKHAMWDPANHSILLIRDPAFPATLAGTVCEQNVSLQSLYPTIVARAGLPIPDHVYGADLAPLLADREAVGWDKSVLMTFGEGNHAIRGERFRFIRYRDGERELYDLSVDPFEYTNLAGFAEYAAVEDGMNTILEVKLNQVPRDFRE